MLRLVKTHPFLSNPLYHLSALLLRSISFFTIDPEISSKLSLPSFFYCHFTILKGTYLPLMFSTALILKHLPFITLLSVTQPYPVQALYQLTREYSGSSFFDRWQFYNNCALHLVLISTFYILIHFPLFHPT